MKHLCMIETRIPEAIETYINTKLNLETKPKLLKNTESALPPHTTTEAVCHFSSCMVVCKAESRLSKTRIKYFKYAA